MRYQRRQSRAAIWALRLAIFALVLLCLSLIGHRVGFVRTPELVPLGAVVLSGAVLALLLASWGFAQLWNNGDKGGARSFWATMIALSVLIPFALFGWLRMSSPSIYDVSTDFDAPPQFSAALRERAPDMNRLGTALPDDALIQVSAYPDVIGKSFAASPDRLFQAVERVLKAYGWPITGRVGNLGHDREFTVTARASSPILGLESDVAIRLIDEDEATFVDMRAVSLYGLNDMGLNAGYITGFMAELNREVNAAPADAE